jgi:GNAT superfamily N-acetyltransferase
MGQRDLPAADHLRSLIGWNQTLSDWRRFLNLEAQGCFVAVLNSEVVGTVTTTTYGRDLAWIGMMLVHPDHRRKGIASRLMVRALEYLKSKQVQCVRLDATPAGKPLYEHLGFIEEWTLTRWENSAPSPVSLDQTVVGEVRTLEANDWTVVEALDVAASGAHRSHLLQNLAHESRAGLVWLADGSLGGWGLLRAGANADYLGPLQCSIPKGAVSLVLALMSHSNGRRIYWDVPDGNETAKGTAQDLGFKPLRPLTRMRLAGKCRNHSRDVMFGIADPALG